MSDDRYVAYYRVCSWTLKGVDCDDMTGTFKYLFCGFFVYFVLGWGFTIGTLIGVIACLVMAVLGVQNWLAGRSKASDC